jgi:uncharacterized membrane protein YjgN (DUF898 family)
MTENNGNGNGDRLIHHGKGSELFLIFIVNTLLKILTLGVYHFWGKTRVRRYVWSQTSFDGERFEYSGTGRELFVGFAFAVAIIALIVAWTLVLSKALALVAPGLEPVAFVALYAVFFVLVGVAIYNARKYMLSRTRWRSIRFGQSGSGFSYATKMIGYGVVNLFTAGFYSPFMKNHLFSYVWNNTWFGSERFSYDGKGQDLFGKFLVAYLLSLPTLGLIWIWYVAAEFRYQTEHVSLGDLRFRSDMRGGALLSLWLGNLLLLVFTLGLAYPWVLLRSIRFGFDHVAVEGDLDYTAIAQSRQRAPATGEGLAEAFDLSAI